MRVRCTCASGIRVLQRSVRYRQPN